MQAMQLTQPINHTLLSLPAPSGAGAGSTGPSGLSALSDPSKRLLGESISLLQGASASDPRQPQLEKSAVVLQSLFRGRRVRADGSYKSLRSSNRPVEGGYGEYVVYYKNSPGRNVEQIIFALAYWRINQFAADLSLDSKVRTERLRDHLFGMGLDIAFIPRTLYELIFICASIEEEMSQKSICALPEQGAQVMFERHPFRGAKEKLAHCWHIACMHPVEIMNPAEEDSNIELYSQPTKPSLNNSHPMVQQLAYRMNTLLIETLKPTGNFTGRQIAECVETQLKYLLKHHETFPSTYDRDFLEKKNRIGASLNFGLEKECGDYYYCFRMGVTESDLDLVADSVALECQTVAQNAFILYRVDTHRGSGEGHLQERYLFGSEPFGTSLFAGALASTGSTVFHHSKEKKLCTRAIIIPYAEYASSPFHIPKTNAICQLSGMGPFYGARTKVPNAYVEATNFGTVSVLDREQFKLLLSDKSGAELHDQVEAYRLKAVLLSKPREQVYSPRHRMNRILYSTTKMLHDIVMAGGEAVKQQPAQTASAAAAQSSHQ